MLELERGVGQAPEGNREPEVDGPVGQDGRERFAVSEPEPGQHGDEHELDHSQTAGGDGDGGQDVGQPVGRQQVDRRDDVPECSHEYPQRRRVEQPVGRRPTDGPSQQSLVLHQHGEPACQPFEQRGETVGIEETDACRHAVDDPAGPLLASGEQVEEYAEGTEEDHPYGGSHHHQNRGRRGAVAVGAGYPEAMGSEEADQRAPEDDIQHHR